MSPPASPNRFTNGEATDEYLSTYKTQVERIQELETKVEKLLNTLADIENFLDEIPSMHLIYKAVREMQEDIGGMWVHQLR